MGLPVVIERDGNSEKVYDLPSRLMKDRIIFLGTPINDAVANAVVMQLLWLESDDPDKDIFMYINSPGGSVTAGLAIYDAMRYVKPEISTVCVGQAASMGCFLLAAGAKGKRFSLPNSRIMMHHVQGGVQGAAPDLMIQVDEMMRLNTRLLSLLAENTGRPFDEVKSRFERDTWMDPDGAKDFGLLDAIHTTSTRVKDV